MELHGLSVLREDRGCTALAGWRLSESKTRKGASGSEPFSILPYYVIEVGR